MGRTQPTFRTSERTNELVRRLSGRVTSATGRRVWNDDLIAAAFAVAARHIDELTAEISKAQQQR